MTSPNDRENFCYRHPTRQSFVLCQRCTRTVCGDCQTPAPVGVICPECMGAAKRNSVKKSGARRTAANSGSSALSSYHRAGSGKLAALAARGIPVATYGIIAITVIVFILQQFRTLGVTSSLEFAGATVSPQFYEPWRMLSAALVHSPTSFLHILLNMYTLLIIGRSLEPLLGFSRFIVLYVVSTFGGSIGVLLLEDPLISVYGASGAIFGLMGAFLVVQGRLGFRNVQLMVIVGINLVIGFIPGFGISWQAHLGGLIVGSLLGWILVETRRRAQFRIQWALIAAVVAGLILLSFRYWVFPLV